MKKLFGVVLGIVLAGSMFMQSAQAQITLMQNKPEIDAQLKEYAATWEKASGMKATIKSCGGGACDLGQQLRADYSAGDMPDIFVIAGLEDYKEWSNIILDLSAEKWTAETGVAFKMDGKVFGFPVAVEGWGMAYNADMLKKAGIDPATLVNLAGYKAAFEKLDSMKAEACNRTFLQTPDVSPFVLAATSMRGIFNHSEVFPLSNFPDFVHLAGVTSIMHWDDRTSSRCDFSDHIFKINTQRLRIDIHKYWFCSTIDSCVRSGDKSHRWYQDFITRYQLK